MKGAGAITSFSGRHALAQTPVRPQPTATVPVRDRRHPRPPPLPSLREDLLDPIIQTLLHLQPVLRAMGRVSRGRIHHPTRAPTTGLRMRPQYRLRMQLDLCGIEILADNVPPIRIPPSRGVVGPEGQTLAQTVQRGRSAASRGTAVAVGGLDLRYRHAHPLHRVVRVSRRRGQKVRRERRELADHLHRRGWRRHMVWMIILRGDMMMCSMMIDPPNHSSLLRLMFRRRKTS